MVSPSKLYLNPLLFPVGFPGILKGNKHLRDFSVTAVRRISFPSQHIQVPVLFLYVFPKSSLSNLWGTALSPALPT